MIEKIEYKKKLLALIVRNKYRNKKGITFFTPSKTTQQFGYMKHIKGKIEKGSVNISKYVKKKDSEEIVKLFSKFVELFEEGNEKNKKRKHKKNLIANHRPCPQK